MSNPCKCCGFPEIKKLIKKDTFGLNLDNTMNGASANWASSFLKPSGTPPEMPEEAPPDDEFNEEYAMDYDDWSCMYAPYRVRDNEVATAWVEGVDGYGIGEIVITAGLDFSKPVKIWSGYGKSDWHFKANSRPKKIRVYLLKAESLMAHQMGEVYMNIQVIDKKESSLLDIK
jgi:hypothetical protein